MIAFRDFAPDRIDGGLLHSDRYETLEAAVAAANAWLASEQVELLSVETVVVPNIWHKDGARTTDAVADTPEGMTAVNEWYQFVRVWYRR